ncbi:protein C-mannosyl-transferase DPY19L3 isoform X1 [Hydra vulgaris]|uniref:protein C-mannosyl-transferase DPY19L3 isoform X1 n=1 Tax=Hydra vulgaris TaxID=6087 RepID=UPI0032EA3861
MKKKNISKTKPTTLLSEYSYKESALNLAPNIFSIVGLLVAFYIGYWYAGYSKQLHENEMWFSNIKQVEREISFRTESGLYFSYYKQLVLAPTLLKGIHSLINDNLTEHLLTINILERFNIYQEVLLAAIYRILPSSIQKNWEYVYFYIDNIFGLHGAMMVTLFIAAWLLSGSPIAGLLANSFFIFHRPHMTRLFKTIPLRESFSLPFIFMQITLLTIFFRRNVRVSFEKPLLVLISLTTFAYTITWQFSQFVMLLQSFALFGVYALEFVETRKVKYVFWIFLGSLSTTCLLMFGNDMIYSSLVSSFCIASLLVMNVQNAKVEGSFLKKLFVLLLRIIITLSLTMIISIIIKKIAKVESDTHVYKFVMTKFGYQDYSIMDFDVRLYLCNGGFDFMPFSELTDGLVYLFPVYFICMIIALVCLMVSFIESLRGAPGVLYNHPEIVFNVILNIFYAVLALSTQRMKFLWFPHMTVVAAGLFCNKNAWKWLLEKFKVNSVFIWLINHSAPIIILALLVQKKLPGMKEELSNLFQFNDPDTVALMNWINTSTPPESSFTGTMQLLAGVKLCTSRPITNHPHYENKFLRQRTKELYQIYARRTPIDVYRILRKHGTNYIILENSICYSSSSCTLTKNLDIENGHDLNPLYKVPRFCDAIKRDSSFQRFFKEVFVNNTFYVYKLLNVDV